VLKPKLGPDLYQHYYGRRQWSNSFQFQVLPRILRFPTARWFGGHGTQARDDLLRRALQAAIDELTAALGEDVAAWRWGALHKVRFAHQLAILPGLEDFFTAGVVDVGGDEQTVLATLWEPSGGYDTGVTPSWRQIVDLADIDASVGTHTVGQSGHPASPHFRDLVPLWSKGEYHPLPFTRPAVEEAADTTMTLVPE